MCLDVEDKIFVSLLSLVISNIFEHPVRHFMRYHYIFFLIKYYFGNIIFSANDVQSILGTKLDLFYIDISSYVLYVCMCILLMPSELAPSHTGENVHLSNEEN